VFTDGFRDTSIVKEWATSVIVEYVPMSHSPGALAGNHHIECDSGLGKGVLLTTRWIKPLHRCTPGQQCAHLITQFQTPEAANIAIREGIVIVGKRTWDRHMPESPGDA